MAYLRAVFNALMVALVLGALAGVGAMYMAAQDGSSPEQKAIVLSAGISTAVNCGAVVFLVLVPVVLAAAYLVRRRRSREAQPTRPG